VSGLKRFYKIEEDILGAEKDGSSALRLILIEGN
jgi:hypothetical protein